MRKNTIEAVKAILACDSTVTGKMQACVLGILNGQDLSQGPEKAEPLPLMLSQSEAGRLLGVSRITIFRMLESGELHRVQVHGVPKIKRSEIEQVAAGETV